MPKKYTALAEMSVAYEVEFDESEIPAGMDEWDYAHHLAEQGAYIECKNGGDFKIYDVVSDTVKLKGFDK
jgi:hypothetical protein